MPTNKPRINITLSDDVSQALERVATRDGVPTATKAAELLLLALEFEEDEILDEVTRSRDTRKAKFVTHKKAWI